MVNSLRKITGDIRKSERGVALLAVLLGIALMTLLVVDFAMTAGLGFVSAANQANELRAYYLARSGVNLGLALLAADARADAKADSPLDSLNDTWAMPFPTMPLEGGNVAVVVVDETRKLNINAMMDQNGTPNQPAIQRMERLFTILNVDPELIPGIVQWITPSAMGAPGGGNADYYLGLRPPYQPRNGPMPTIADLQLVKGINEAVFNRIRPFLTVMPETVVNGTGARGAGAGDDGGSEDRRADNRGAADAAVFQGDRSGQ
jgi:general secretion pathway protein K